MTRKALALIACIIIHFTISAQTFKSYTTTNGLLDNKISGVAFSPNNDTVWISSYNGVNQLTGDTFKSITSFPNMNSSPGMTIATTKKGDVLFSASYIGNGWGGGVSRYNGTTWNTYNDNNSNMTGGLCVNVIHEDKEGNLWFCGDRLYVCMFDGSQWVKHELDDMAMSITSDKDNNIWVAANRKLYKYDGSSWHTITNELARELTAFSTVVIDSLNHPWFGANDGLYHYDGENWEKFTTEDGLPLNFVRKLTVDYAGNLWLGASGLVKYDYDTFVNYETEDSVFRSGLNAIAPSADGSIWVGTDKGLYTLSFDDVQLSLSENSLQFDASPVSGQTVDINSNTNWKITTHCDWVNCSIDSGSNNGSITITCNDNNTGEERTTDVYIRSNSSEMNKITVTQRKDNTSSVQQETKPNDGSVYLDKSTLQVYVNYQSLKQVEVFNTKGMKILTSNQQTIDVSNFNYGVYFVRITTLNGHTSTHNIIR